MDNQLDLNRSEAVYYETVVNDLMEQLEATQNDLEKMTQERDDVLATSTMLGDRLQKMVQFLHQFCINIYHTITFPSF